MQMLLMFPWKVGGEVVVELEAEKEYVWARCLFWHYQKYVATKEFTFHVPD